MCGIVGFTGNKDTKTLDSMLKTIIHRGPDGEGKFESDNFTIGMRRLCIVDPNGGWQPIWNETKTVALVFNGEIYNYQEIWDELEKKGHKFTSDHSDTETVVHGYEEWGEGVLKKLRGMFAFAIYDSEKQEIFIARDRLGIKPLFYTQINDRFYFGSEIKALLEVKNSSRQMNKQAVIDYLVNRTHDHLEETFFKNIFRVPAGHYMRISPRGEVLCKTKYWELEVNLEFTSSKPDKVYAEELKELFIDSVKCHLLSDVPIGVTLSGGLDSTGVVSVMAKLFKEKQADLHTKNLLTFSAVYPGNSIDESKYIDIAAEFVGSEQHKVTPTAEGFWSEIDNWLYTQEEPTISSAPYAIYTVMKEAAKYVRVMLSGQGGDELFAGYIPYFAAYLTSARSNNKYAQALRESLMGFDLYSNFIKQKFLARKSNAVSEIKSLVNNNFFDIKPTFYLPDKNLNQRLSLDVTKYSIPNVLRYEDHNAMAFSIETRVPFLDHKFVEYAFSLPIDQKIKMGWNRYAYRNAMKGIIPEAILKRRKKIGFTTPETMWMKNKSDIIKQIFRSKEFNNRGIFNASKVLEDYTLWTEGKKQADAMMFWRILNVELWIRRFNIH